MNFVSKFDGVLPFTGNHPKAQLHVDTVSTKAPADAIIVQDAQLLFTGDFKRSGSDLVISKGDHELRLHDYFKGDKHAPLASSDGAYLTANIVDALVGHVQVAQADGSASAAKIIGHVTKLTGSATVVRNGVSIILNNGDNVHQGDVVSSGSNSTLGITFIDGSVFGLASNAKMVLNEMVYDPNGSSNSSLMSLVSGTISFVAGATAKHGDMKVDTPVATMGIRGTACLVEIEFDLSVVQPNPPGPQLAPPVKFQVLVEPDGTSGSYVLLDRATLAPIATVNQPGTVTTVSGTGTVSFLASAQLSPELMKLISEVFSQKFTDNSNPKSDTHFTDIGVLQNTFGFNTALIDPSIGAVKVVFVQETAPTALPSAPGTSGHIPGPPDVFADSKVTSEQLHLTGSSLIDKTTGRINYADVNAGDTPTARTEFQGFTYKDGHGNDVTATLTAAQLAAVKSAEVPLVVVQDPSGKNYGTATWSYDIKDGVLDFLADGETLTLTYRALVDTNFAPANDTGFFDFTITITGTNDKPTIVANLTNASGAVVEDSDVDESGNITADGSITFNDVDLTDIHTASFVLKSSHTNVSLPGFADGASIGKFKLTPISEVAADADTKGSLGWTFTLSDDDPTLQSLAEGQTITLVFTVTVSDGHGGTVSQDVTVKITGSNDSPNHAPIIVGELTEATGEVVEDVNVNGWNEVAAAGTITFRDVDLIDTHTAGFVPLSSSSSAELPGFTNDESYIGEFELSPVSEDNTDTINTGSVGWTFKLDDHDPVLQSLAEGQTITQVYRVTITDNHGAAVEQDVTVTITGTEDAPTIVADLTTALGGVVEDGKQTASGTITFQDVDLIDSHVVSKALTGGSASAALPGFDPANQPMGTLALTLHENTTDIGNLGTVDWTFTIDNALAQQLAAGQVITQTYTVCIEDNHGGVITQDITVTITGTNDVPVIGVAKQEASIAERADAHGSDELDRANGSISFTDVDLIDTHSVAIAGVVASGKTAGLAKVSAATIEQWLSLDDFADSAGGATGTQKWSFHAADHYFDYLAEGEHLTLTYTIQVGDGNGGFASKDVTITIDGSNDAPEINGGPQGATLCEFSNTHDSNSLHNASGVVTFTDLDLSDVHSTVKGVALSGTVSGLAAPAVASQWLTLGTFADSTDGQTGKQAWSFSAEDKYFDYLAQGESVTLTYTVEVDDGHGGIAEQDVVITVDGANDKPVIAEATSASLDEKPGISGSPEADKASGTVAFTDLDLSDLPVVSAKFASYGYVDAAHSVHLLTGSQEIAIEAALTVTPGAGNTNNGSASWSYSVPDSTFDFLAEGDTIVLTYDISVYDGHATASTPITVAIHGANDAPTLANVHTGTPTDTAANDSFTNLTGTLVGTDVDNGETATLSYAALDEGVAVNAAVAGLYGSLTVNADGCYVYVPNAAAINALGAGCFTDSFTVQTTDVHGATGTATFTVEVKGADDRTVITGASTKTLTETDSAQSTGGTLVATDPDSSNLFTVQSNVAGDHGYGKFSIDAAGVWTYTMNNAHNEFVGGVDYADSITVATVDGTQQVITVTIHGTDDPTVITGTSTKMLTETNEALSTGGKLVATDPDSSNLFTVQSNVAGDHGYGKFSIDAAGVWAYTMYNAHNEFVGGTDYTDSITVATADGTTQQLVVTIHGTNDAAVISGTSRGTVEVADDGPGSGNTTATGRLTDTDVDNVPNTFVAAAAGSHTDHGYGTYQMTADGVWTYTLDCTNHDVRRLEEGHHLTDTFTVHTADGTAQVVTITITDNDDPDHDVYAADGLTILTRSNAFIQDNNHNFVGNSAANTIAGNNDSMTDRINAQGGDDTIYGRAGNDIIRGGSGNDTIYAGSGNDTVIAGADADQVWGGSGSDNFVFDTAADSTPSSFDTIHDFKPGVDHIGVAGLGFSASASGFGALAVHGINWTQVGADTVVVGDTDGNSANAEFKIVLSNVSATSLHLTDFHLT